MSKVIAVTGASGFVGAALVANLSADPSVECRAIYRTLPPTMPNGAFAYAVGDLGDAPDLLESLHGVDLVIHTAGRAHSTEEHGFSGLDAYRTANVRGLINVASAAVTAGVKRLAFVSSIKVNGESTSLDRPFTEADIPAPADAYGVTKWEAEQALWRTSDDTGLEAVVLRSPLVYGPGAKGNLRRLVRLVEAGTPLPLKAARNLRSMISLGNLTSAIILAGLHSSSPGRTFLVSDQQDLSTANLIELIAAALVKPSKLWSFPVPLLKGAAVLVGQGGLATRLLSSLRVDSSAISSTIGWRPRRDVGPEIAKMVVSLAKQTRGVRDDKLAH